MSKTECTVCNREFASNEALSMHNQAKHLQEVNKPILLFQQRRRIRNWTYVMVALGIVVALVYFIILNIETLPPTTMQGHAEVNPAAHILKEPMQLVAHKHMLEHADGKGRPGAIINYNCQDFECEGGLIEKLEAFAVRYPEHVYVAPFSNMDAKIVLTELNRQKVLEEYDEEVIDSFVR